MKKKMGSAGYWLVALLLILAVACGGGGGGGSSSGGGNGGGGAQSVVPGIFIEAQNGSGQTIDIANLRPGTTAQVRLVRYDALGNRTVLTPTSISISGNTAGVTFSGGNLSANAPTGYFEINASFSGDAYSADGHFTNSTIQVSGFVNTFLNTKKPKNLQLDFYNNAGSLVGVATVDGTGAFHGFMDSSAATRFTVDVDSVDNFNNDPGNANRLYKVFRYQSTNFTSGDFACSAALPALGATGATLPATVFVPEVSSGPPPPPSGCS
jgi:hypothetical protein